MWIIEGQGHTVLTVRAGGFLGINSFAYDFSLLSTSVCKTARYGLKYYLKEPLIPKQQLTMKIHQRAIRQPSAKNRQIRSQKNDLIKEYASRENIQQAAVSTIMFK